MLPFRLDILQQVRATPPPHPSRRVARDQDRVAVTAKSVTELDRAADRYRERRGGRRRAKGAANMVARAVAPDMIAAPNVKAVRSGAPVRIGTTRHRESEADLIATTNVDRKHHTNQPRRKLFALRRVSQQSNNSFRKVKLFYI